MSTIVRKLISTANAAKPVAPYNQAVVADRTVYVSGCLGLDKATMQLVPGGATEQTEMALKNLQAVLKAADSDIDKVVKNTVFVKDLNDFAAVNEVYKRVFSKDFPARSCVQVAKLPMDALVEIECIALTGTVYTVPNE
ncbi:rutC family protein UK114 [Drosophila nasuta]|uniref:RutC family protein UK114 n=1 Tax=Drosophila albomicans TaxID=7291 RepID=A0A6P8W3L5_DROAB|nr:rutC family protein UK114 [Drosophila albomicans]XP_060654888.1 rutC family protein UK114 [Drosophila nasuta]